MFQLTDKTNVLRNARGKVAHIEHILEPYEPAALQAVNAQQLAAEYLMEVAPAYGINTAELENVSAALTGEPRAGTGSKVSFHAQKDIAGSIVVDYQQTFNGLEVWGANFAVHIASEPMRATSSVSTLHQDIELGNAMPALPAQFLEKITTVSLGAILGLEADKSPSKINGKRLVIYEYDPKQRFDPEADNSPAAKRAEAFGAKLPTLPLPAVPAKIRAGLHYVVAEALFSLSLPGWGQLNWRALIEVETNAVLYLRAFVSCITGSVFVSDPISLSGNPAATPAAPASVLDPLRTTVTLGDLVASNPQALKGVLDEVENLETPNLPPPTTAPPFTFVYSSVTPDFAAVSAYYHVDCCFELVKNMGFPISSYFNGTSFPVPVDHEALGGAVNARCNGDTQGDGVGSFVFGSAGSGTTVGIAADPRVVMHEFGHALLWDQVHNPNFGFAHSAGDALGAILNDPQSRAPDRLMTFPFEGIDRRHDRKVTDGWGWFGSHYDTQYGGEQVLSTTLFRIYQAAGGASAQLADRQFAARYVNYLIVKAIGTLTTMTPYPEVFATALMNADLTTVTFEGHVGGSLHKVIRWAFEKQGLYQPNAAPGTTTPVTKEGNPPAVDVYLDDGRHGEYQYQPNPWYNPDMWVRRNPDGGTIHQNPAAHVKNYIYVRVRNRGTQAATNVTVRTFHSKAGTGFVWPDHWAATTTAVLPAAGAIAPGGQTIIGPFEWVPDAPGSPCLLAMASATGDAANDTTVHAAIPMFPFITCDNNIGQRNVTVVSLLPKFKDILEKIKKIPFEVMNPFETMAAVELRVILPPTMREMRMNIAFENAGGPRFRLGPLASRQVMFSAVKARPGTVEKPIPGLREIPGVNVPETEVTTLGRRAENLIIETLINGRLAGGMVYVLQEGGEGLEELAPKAAEAPNLAAIQEIIDQAAGKGLRMSVKNLQLNVEFEMGEPTV